MKPIDRAEVERRFAKIASGYFSVHRESAIDVTLALLTEDRARRPENEALSDSYLRIRKIVGAWNTKPGGVDRFEVTEAAVTALKARADAVKQDRARMAEEWAGRVHAQGCGCHNMNGEYTREESGFGMKVWCRHEPHSHPFTDPRCLSLWESLRKEMEDGK